MLYNIMSNGLGTAYPILQELMPDADTPCVRMVLSSVNKFSNKSVL